ncbi:catalase family protein [Kaarinaea lacus]
MFREAIDWLVQNTIRIFRRLDPYYRDYFDAVFQKPLMWLTQFFINLFRKRDILQLAEEQPLPHEQHIVTQITEQMNLFLRKHYEHKSAIAERAGNTKTYGLLKASFTVNSGLPEALAVGLFKHQKTYPAYVRYAGPGPLVTRDIDNNGILSIGVKVMDVPGEKLIDDEKYTQDFLGISAPTFTTPNLAENLKLQREIYRDTPAWYFVNPFDSHILDAIMQGLFARTHANPLELRYYSCVPYLYGQGRAIKYSITPRIKEKSKITNLSENYLRVAMVTILDKEDVELDFAIQFQTDAYRMPIENASVVWPEKLSPFINVATIKIPSQRFDSEDQLAFARNLTFNPWHSLPQHRPLGNQNRGRKHIYLTTSKMRQSLNNESKVEPTGAEVFGNSPN